MSWELIESKIENFIILYGKLIKFKYYRENAKGKITEINEVHNYIKLDDGSRYYINSICQLKVFKSDTEKNIDKLSESISKLADSINIQLPLLISNFEKQMNNINERLKKIEKVIELETIKQQRNKKHDLSAQLTFLF